ncbi:hypothetical protein HORIV_51970 [Vreelandella olivaria]|uniref:Uncharacterized protein n=1 Tax=Vreelandella olivaria TaxID=390919 RepID=A0ABM7GQ01_9GAMM|nr:hypothetical protein HORIV_51970 [Halomonas olivaria]
MLQTTRSGALVFNATLLHHAVPSLPFGGVGESGMGRTMVVTALNVLAICVASSIKLNARLAACCIHLTDAG